MVVVSAMVGLIAGILAGLFNPSGIQGSAGRDLSREPGEPTTTTAPPLPETFYTVVLTSVPRSEDRSEVEARAQDFRGEGIQDVGVLDHSRYSSVNPDYWAVYSGVFESEERAAAHRDDLQSRYPDLARCYVRKVTNEP